MPECNDCRTRTIGARCGAVLAALSLLFVAVTTGDVRAGSGLDAADRVLIQRLGAHTDTLRLEGEIAALLARQDKERLRSMAERIADEDGTVFERLARVAQSGEARDTAFALAMGACQQAGAFIRLIAIDLAAERLAVTAAGRGFRTDPAEAGDRFAATVNLCEKTRDLPRSSRQIGTTCIIDGIGCL